MDIQVTSAGSRYVLPPDDEILKAAAANSELYSRKAALEVANQDVNAGMLVRAERFVIVFDRFRSGNQ